MLSGGGWSVLSHILQKQWVRDALAGTGLLLCALALICWPKEVSTAVQEGLQLCYNVILPSLFPFFILTSLVISLGLAGYLGRLLEPVMRPLFHVGGSCAAALALGFVGGYPVGARAALTLYEEGQCTRTECERLLAFCNNSGPAFILGVVGAGVFADSRVGLLLCLVHAAASLCVGLVFRFYHRGEEKGGLRRASSPIAAQRFTTAFTGAVKGAVTSTLNICAFVVCFTVIIRLCFLSGLLPALAGLLAEAEPIWFHLDRSDGVWSDIVNGTGSPDYLSHALALEDYHAGEFVQTFFGERPEGAPESRREMITLCLPEMKIWLYFYSSSPWVCVHHAGEDYWAEFRHKDGPDKLVFDAVYSWLEAESEWVSGEGSEKSQI